MKSFKQWFSIDLPAGWAEVFIRAIKAAVVAFVVLQLKEWIETGVFDTPGTAVDAALIAGGTFAFNAILARFVVSSPHLRFGSGRKPDTSRSPLG